MRRFGPLGRHTRRWILKLLTRIDPPGSIADLGCGDGELLILLKRVYPGAELLGCDFSRAAVEICRERLPGGRFFHHDLEDPANPFGSILDVGICSEVLEHLADDLEALRNMTAFCRHLILTLPGGHLDETARRVGHLRHYSRASAEDLARQAGLEVLYTRQWGFPLAYPFYRRVLNRSGYSTLTGGYSLSKRLLCQVLYSLFWLNDLSPGGDKIFLLAQNPRLV